MRQSFHLELKFIRNIGFNTASFSFLVLHHLQRLLRELDVKIYFPRSQDTV